MDWATVSTRPCFLEWNIHLREFFALFSPYGLDYPITCGEIKCLCQILKGPCLLSTRLLAQVGACRAPTPRVTVLHQNESLTSSLCMCVVRQEAGTSPPLQHAPPIWLSVLLAGDGGSWVWWQILLFHPPHSLLEDREQYLHFGAQEQQLGLIVHGAYCALRF